MTFKENCFINDDYIFKKDLLTRVRIRFCFSIAGMAKWKCNNCTFEVNRLKWDKPLTGLSTFQNNKKLFKSAKKEYTVDLLVNNLHKIKANNCFIQTFKKCVSKITA